VSTARVEKSWKSAGLSKYPTEALLGTLGHYGVPLTEAAFKDLAQKKYPVGIALEWLETWKGTGQFKDFPLEASAELWKRLVPDRLDPSHAAEALSNLMDELGKMVHGSSEARVGKAFEAVNALKAKIPQEKGGADRAFVTDMFARFDDESMREFDGLAESLAKEGHVEDAEEFAKVEEFLFPEREGVVRAVIKAADGHWDVAEKAILERVDASGLSTEARVFAIDALIHIHSKHAEPKANKLLDEAEKAEDYHLALGMVDRIAHLYRQENKNHPGFEALAARAQKLVAAHDKAHPHHAH
jgi:hypothetical protein